MGCDIHGWVEKKCGDKWIAVNALEDPADQRNYMRFAALAGVRGDGPEPRGVPGDVSDTAKLHIDQWDTDGHSHSWCSLRDAIQLWGAVHYTGEERSAYALDYPAQHWFGIDDDQNLDDYRVVFWFDN